MIPGGTPAAPILLLGARGQVGGALATRLQALGRVVSVTRADTDLERPDAIRELVRRVGPRIIVNAAAYTAVDDAETDVDRCRLVNAVAPRALAEEGTRLGAILVHFSTNYVFDGESSRPYREDDPTGPLNVYGVTKREGEWGVADASPSHVILRTAGVYGWTGRNFMRRILALAGERAELEIVADQFVAPTPASIVADATVQLLSRGLAPGNQVPFGTYHLTTTGSTSWFGFAQRILEHAGSGDQRRPPRLVAVPTERFPVAARRPRNGLLDTDKLTRHSGVELPDWESALRRTFEDNENRS